VLLPAANLALALLLSGVVILLVGENPLRALRLLVTGAFGSAEALGYTLYYATDFVFTGLAVAIAFHAGLFNIGAEGQAYVAGLAVALVCLGGESWPPRRRSGSISGTRAGATRCGRSGTTRRPPSTPACHRRGS
jgi:simple sugar transport system permease protein